MGEDKAILLKNQEDLKAFQLQAYIEDNKTFVHSWSQPLDLPNQEKQTSWEFLQRILTSALGAIMKPILPQPCALGFPAWVPLGVMVLSVWERGTPSISTLLCSLHLIKLSINLVICFFSPTRAGCCAMFNGHASCCESSSICTVHSFFPEGIELAL